MNSKVKEATILIVDDTPDNIDVLIGILGDTYHTKVALNGEKALELVNIDPPDLILLDVMMPEMDGFEVCKRLKDKSNTQKIPVIFVTAKGEAEDENCGFEIGGVDYITKPVNPIVVRARVKTHLELRNSQVRVEQLLSRTLLGSVKMMTQILSFLSPDVFNRSSRIKKYVRAMADSLQIEQIWRLEMAAMLSELGCLTVPVDIRAKILEGALLSAGEQKTFNAHPELGAEFLSHIPGLEVVAEIIRKQLYPIRSGLADNPSEWDAVTQGACLLNISLEFDRLILSGETGQSALSIIRQDAMKYPAALVSALEKNLSEFLEMIPRIVDLQDLREGMVLDQDLIDEEKSKIAAKQTELTQETIRLIMRFNQNCKIHVPIQVLVSANLKN